MSNYTHTLADIADAMREHDRHNTPGSESAQRQLFVADAHYTTGVYPFGDAAHETTAPDAFAAFWLAIAERDYSLAGQYGDVPAEWRDE